MCRAGVSRKLRKTISFLWTRGQRGIVAIAVVYLDTAVLRESARKKESVKRREWARGRGREESVHPQCAVAHVGHLFFCCHLSWQWQMTQHQSGEFWRQSPRTYSPQAKLVQDPVHLLTAPPRRPPPPPIQSIHCPTALVLACGLMISVLTLQRHISPSLSQ